MEVMVTRLELQKTRGSSVLTPRRAHTTHRPIESSVHLAVISGT
jgi:hypothetical protein